MSALLQEVLRAEIPDGEKRTLFEDWDRVLQLDITRAPTEDQEQPPAEALELARRRDVARAAKDWAEADALRGQIEALGWAAEDGPDGTRLRSRP